MLGTCPVISKSQLFGDNPPVACFISPQTNRWVHLVRSISMSVCYQILFTESKCHPPFLSAQCYNTQYYWLQNIAESLDQYATELGLVPNLIHQSLCLQATAF